MTNSGKISLTQYVSMPFNEPMLQTSDVSHQGNGSSVSVGFLSSNAVSVQDNHQIKTMQVASPPSNSIAMSTLLDFIVYKTYHELTVIADILPSKNDMERKNTIVDFSSRTRQMFVRLLGLVKWASSVGKVVRCSDISTFLDRQVCFFKIICNSIFVNSILIIRYYCCCHSSKDILE